MAEQEIAVALDHSETAMEAARQAGELAAAMDCPLVFLHAFEGHPDELHELERLKDGFEGVVQLSDEEVREAAEASGQKLFNEARASLATMPPESREVILLGEPAQALEDYCRQNPETLLVIGRRGQSRLKAVLLGSVSDHLVRHAVCPVLVVH
jgi:nucleotide-binding universal stress UspA family protein